MYISLSLISLLFEMTSYLVYFFLLGITFSKLTCPPNPISFSLLILLSLRRKIFDNICLLLSRRSKQSLSGSIQWCLTYQAGLRPQSRQLTLMIWVVDWSPSISLFLIFFLSDFSLTVRRWRKSWINQITHISSFFFFHSYLARLLKLLRICSKDSHSAAWSIQ